MFCHAGTFTEGLAMAGDRTVHRGSEDEVHDALSDELARLTGNARFTVAEFAGTPRRSGESTATGTARRQLGGSTAYENGVLSR